MLSIHTSRVGQVTIFHIAGRLDSINAAMAQTTLFQIIDTESLKDIVLNMAQVNYISAAGLRVLRTLHEKTGKVRIASPSQRVMDVMQITGLDAQYKMYETQTAALHNISPITNAHTHLELGWLKHLCPGVSGLEFVRWIRERVDRAFTAAKDLEKQLKAAAEAGVQELVNSGVTAAGDVSLFGLSIEPLMHSGLKGIVYIELLATHPERLLPRLKATQELIDRYRPHERGGIRIGLQIHAPYSVHPDLWAKALEYARKEALPLCIHAAESPAETEYLLHGTGDFLTGYYDDTLPAVPVPHRTPIACLDDLGALDLKPLLIHTVQVTDDDIQRIKRAGCTVVHCPRSNLRLRCGRMPLEKFLAAGVPVLLGTDSLASSPSLNIFDELEVAVALHHGHVESDVIVNLVHGKLPGLV